MIIFIAPSSVQIFIEYYAYVHIFVLQRFVTSEGYDCLVTWKESYRAPSSLIASKNVLSFQFSLTNMESVLKKTD